MQVETPKNRKFIILLMLVIIIGFIGWILPFIGWPTFINIQSPNTEPHGIAVDSKGNIYCGSNFYNRIQKYDPDGKYIMGLPIDYSTKIGFTFRIDEKDQLCVFTDLLYSADQKSATYRKTVYNTDGDLIHNGNLRSEDKKYPHEIGNSTFDASGNEYIFKGFIFPRVIRKTPQGTEKTVIKTPILLWLIQAPFPVFIFIAISMVSIICIDYKSDARKLGISVKELVNLPSKRSISKALLILSPLFCVFGMLIYVSSFTHLALLIIGFVMLWTMLLINVFTTAITILLINIIYYRTDPENWRGMFSQSIKVKYEATKKIQSIETPATIKAGKAVKWLWLISLATWAVLMTAATIAAIYLQSIGRLKETLDLIEKVITNILAK